MTFTSVGDTLDRSLLAVISAPTREASIDQVSKMKLIVALAATAAAFVGPSQRLPSASVGRTLQTKAQPAMLLGGLRARANNLVPTRRPSAEVPSA